MNEPHKCDCQKLVIALLDRADALHREERMILECGYADAYSKLMKLQAENERMRKAGDAMEDAIRSFDSSKPCSHARMNLTAKEYEAVQAWLAAKGVQS